MRVLYHVEVYLPFILYYNNTVTVFAHDSALARNLEQINMITVIIIVTFAMLRYFYRLYDSIFVLIPVRRYGHELCK